MLGEKCPEQRIEFKDLEVRKDLAFWLNARDCVKRVFVLGGKFGYDGLEKHQENLRKYIFSRK